MLPHANEASEFEIFNHLADTPAAALAYAFREEAPYPLAKARDLARPNPSSRGCAADN